jgi:tRNA G10  N-methylase Trm11
MKYFFVLGSNQALSLAELFTVLPAASRGKVLNRTVLIAELEDGFDAQQFIKKIGGIIKIGVITEEDIPLYSTEMVEAVKKMLKPSEGKYKFGISNYAKYASPAKDKHLAMLIKKYLKEKEASCRWVIGKERVLSSVIVEQNLMNERGIEIVIFGDYKKCQVGKTLAVQAFKDLSYRDYGRPGRDDHSGMLPPKLAQILINLTGAKPGDKLLDPFCGSGTIATEALILGHRDIVASDISEKAVADTRQNIAWTKRKFSVVDAKEIVMLIDAKKINTKITAGSIDAIATEPYLGPQRGAVNQAENKKELEKLYSSALKAFYEILKKDGRLAMIWPVRVEGVNKIFLNPDLGKFERLNPLVNEYKKEYKNGFSQRGNLLYGREGQKVWREIVVLKK